MTYIPLEKLVKKNEASLYKLVLTAAARGNELAIGSNPMVKTQSKKVSTVALEEIAAGKVTYEETKTAKGKKSA